MKYINCKEIGRSTKTCKNPRVPDPFRVPTENKRGMPMKNAIETNRETKGASTSTPQQETVSRGSGRLRGRGKKHVSASEGSHVITKGHIPWRCDSK